MEENIKELFKGNNVNDISLCIRLRSDYVDILSKYRDRVLKMNRKDMSLQKMIVNIVYDFCDQAVIEMLELDKANNLIVPKEIKVIPVDVSDDGEL